MGPFAYNMESPFGRFSVSLHHLIVQRFIAKNCGVRGVPAILVIDLSFVAGFYYEDVNVPVRFAVKKSTAGGTMVCVAEGEKSKYEQAAEEQFS